MNATTSEVVRDTKTLPTKQTHFLDTQVTARHKAATRAGRKDKRRWPGATEPDKLRLGLCQEACLEEFCRLDEGDAMLIQPSNADFTEAAGVEDLQACHGRM